MFVNARFEFPISRHRRRSQGRGYTRIVYISEFLFQNNTISHGEILKMKGAPNIFEVDTAVATHSKPYLKLPSCYV